MRPTDRAQAAAAAELPDTGGPYAWRLRVWTRFLAPPAQVWAQKTDPAAIRDELGPLVRFSFDAAALDRARSGALPVQADGRLVPPGVAWPVTLVAWHEPDDAGLAAFTDTSENALMAAWHHTHLVEPTSDGCRYVDDVFFRAASPLPGDLVARATAALFRHRHRRAARRLPADARATGVVVLRQLLPHERDQG